MPPSIKMSLSSGSSPSDRRGGQQQQQQSSPREIKMSLSSGSAPSGRGQSSRERRNAKVAKYSAHSARLEERNSTRVKESNSNVKRDGATGIPKKKKSVNFQLPGEDTETANKVKQQQQQEHEQPSNAARAEKKKIPSALGGNYARKKAERAEKKKWNAERKLLEARAKRAEDELAKILKAQKESGQLLATPIIETKKKKSVSFSASISEMFKHKDELENKIIVVEQTRDDTENTIVSEMSLGSTPSAREGMSNFISSLTGSVSGLGGSLSQSQSASKSFNDEASNGNYELFLAGTSNSKSTSFDNNTSILSGPQSRVLYDDNGNPIELKAAELTHAVSFASQTDSIQASEAYYDDDDDESIYSESTAEEEEELSLTPFELDSRQLRDDDSSNSAPALLAVSIASRDDDSYYSNRSTSSGNSSRASSITRRLRKTIPLRRWSSKGEEGATHSLVDSMDSDSVSTAISKQQSISSKSTTLSKVSLSKLPVVYESQPLGGPKYYVATMTRKDGEHQQSQARVVHEAMPLDDGASFKAVAEEKGYEVLEYHLTKREGVGKNDHAVVTGEEKEDDNDSVRRGCGVNNLCGGSREQVGEQQLHDEEDDGSITSNRTDTTGQTGLTGVTDTSGCTDTTGLTGLTGLSGPSAYTDTTGLTGVSGNSAAVSTSAGEQQVIPARAMCDYRLFDAKKASACAALSSVGGCGAMVLYVLLL